MNPNQFAIREATNWPEYKYDIEYTDSAGENLKLKNMSSSEVIKLAKSDVVIISLVTDL